jgi:hypothetical protein
VSFLKKVFIVVGLICLGVILLIFVGALSLGYLPGIGQVFGLGQAKDLGVSYSDDDYLNAKTKLDAALESQVIQTSFTSEEITALVNGCTVSACVLSDVQVKTSADGLVELAGVIDRDEAISLLTSLAPAQEGSELGSVIALLPPEPSFYLEAEMIAENDIFILNVSDAKVAGIDIPEDNLDDLSAELTSAWTEYLSSLTGTQINSLTVTAEGVYVDGNLTGFDEELLAN